MDALKATTAGSGLNLWFQFVSGQEGRDPEVEYVEVFDVQYTIPSSGVKFIAMF